MRTIPVDASKVRMISAGDTVETVDEYVELADGGRRKSGAQATNDDGIPQWVIYAFVPGDAGERPETVKIKVTSRDEPRPGQFGDVLEFDDLAVLPYVDSGSGRVAMSWRSTGVKVAGSGSRKSGPTPVADAS